MLKNNIYYIKTEINKQQSVEIVHEIKDEKKYQIPTFEEFIKTYEEDEKVSDSYSREFIDLDKVPGYGPGNSQSQETIKNFAKLSGRKVISEVVGPLLGPPTITVGAALKKGADDVKNIVPLCATMVAKNPEALNDPDSLGKEFKNLDSSDKDEFLKWISNLGDDLMFSGLESLGGEFFSALSSELIKMGHPKLGVNIKEGWGGYEEGTSGPLAMAEPFTALAFHLMHTNSGETYNSDCKICKE